MEIIQLRAAIRARNFDRTCRFYGETLALPKIEAWEGADLRRALYQAGSGVIEVIGRPEGARPGTRDELFNYQGPQHEMTLTILVPSAQKAFEELHFREKNIPGGLRRDGDGALIFETHDPDGVKIVFREVS